MRPQSSIFLVAAWALLAAATPLDIASQKQYPMAIPSTSKDLKVPGHSPAYYCEDPSDDLFQISSFEFSPTRPRIGYYLDIYFWGYFTAETGDVPWLNITGSVNGRDELGPVYDAPLCDINVFQKVLVPRPGGGHEGEYRQHRSCPQAFKRAMRPSAHRRFLFIRKHFLSAGMI
ncbi:Phosphatidylglycerol/phosphatidylinositol transfer protein [Apiospora kogelbergensis]|uniref:Phosphatidylglycerol/phosphatidylinositol transfer protein n=1 Tax=Apiospora kogelbergensis TaxID=1337665 RepID=UPI0031305F87